MGADVTAAIAAEVSMLGLLPFVESMLAHSFPLARVPVWIIAIDPGLSTYSGSSVVIVQEPPGVPSALGS
jgi:hypothetical protein